jgi:large subunit ribosomal protein L32
MALPKVKLSKSKKGRRRSHLALALVQIQACPNCKHMRRPHTVCPNCGHYGAGAGREVIKAKE